MSCQDDNRREKNYRPDTSDYNKITRDVREGRNYNLRDAMLSDDYHYDDLWAYKVAQSRYW